MIEYLPLIKKENIEKLKDEIEKSLNCKLKIENDIVTLDGEPLNVIKAKKVLEAYFSGFELNDAINLINDEYTLEVINVKDYTRKVNRMFQLLGRVIGKKGKSRRKIEEVTNTKIIVNDKDKRIFILGKMEKVLLAKRCVEMLLEGKKHSTVFNFLDREIKKL